MQNRREIGLGRVEVGMKVDWSYFGGWSWSWGWISAVKVWGWSWNLGWGALGLNSEFGRVGVEVGVSIGESWGCIRVGKSWLELGFGRVGLEFGARVVKI